MDEGQRSYYKYLLNHPILSHTEEKETLKLVAKGDTVAREKMVLHNMKLVYQIAWKSNNHLPLDDRFQAGILGLYKALDKFNLAKGKRFST
ncbi:MAG TPA: RNA polymerase subunit sigma-70, partial [bacterium]|nr:RNA polymerase subunit sigma-70 [bacterium]